MSNQLIRTNINEPRTLKIYDNGERATVVCRMLRPGVFTSGVNDVTFNITNEHLIKARNHYNGKLLEYAKDIFRKELTDYELEQVQMAPVGAEHEIHQDAIKGRIIGKAWIEEDPVKKVNWLMATLEILGSENVAKLQNGTYKSTSINFNTQTGEILELSFVFKPAIDDSCILTGKRTPQSTNAILSAKINDLNNYAALMQKVSQSLFEFNSTIDKNNQDVAQLRAKAEHIKLRGDFADRLQNLVRLGKITRVEMKCALASIPDNADNAVFNSVIAAFNQLGVRAKRGKIYSSNDEDFQKLIFSGESEVDPKQVSELASQLAAKFGIKSKADAAFKAPSGGDVKNKAETEVKHTQGADHKVALRESEDYKAEKARLQAKGDTDGLKALCRMAGEEYEDKSKDKDESKEGKFSAKQVEELQAQLSALQATNEELIAKRDALEKERSDLEAKFKASQEVVNIFKNALENKGE